MMVVMIMKMSLYLELSITIFCRARTVIEATNARHKFSAIINLQLCAKAGMGKLETACCLFVGIFFFDKLLKHTYY